MVAPGFEPLFYAGMGLTGPAFGVIMTSTALETPVVGDPVVGSAMVCSYVVLGMGQLAYCRMSIRGVTASRSHSPPDWRLRAYLVAGAAFVVVEGILGLRIWLPYPFRHLGCMSWERLLCRGLERTRGGISRERVGLLPGRQAGYSATGAIGVH